MIRAQMPAADLVSGRLDISYGVIAGLILIVGFGRVFYCIKGAALYLDNPILWGKIVAFLVLGLPSVPPTMAVVA